MTKILAAFPDLPDDSIFVTWQAIEEGDVHVIRSQWCAYVPSSDVSTFLQVLAVLFDQTIADGREIVQLASYPFCGSFRPSGKPK